MFEGDFLTFRSPGKDFVAEKKIKEKNGTNNKPGNHQHIKYKRHKKTKPCME